MGIAAGIDLGTTYSAAARSELARLTLSGHPSKDSPIPASSTHPTSLRVPRSGGEIYIAIDSAMLATGFIAGMLNDPYRGMKKVIAATHKFVDEIDLSMFQVGITVFRWRSAMWQPASSDARVIHGALDRILANDARLSEMTGGIPTSGSVFVHPFDTLLSAFNGNGRKIALVLTGQVWSGLARADAVAKASQCHQLGIETIVLGGDFGIYGTDDDATYLDSLSSIKGLSVSIGLKNLSKNLSKVARAINA